MEDFDLKDFWSRAIELLLDTPKLVLALACARISGEIWEYMYSTYISNDQTQTARRQTHIFKSAVGLLWLAPFYLLVYFYAFESLLIDDENGLKAIVTTIVVGLSMQLIVFVGFVIVRALK